MLPNIYNYLDYRHYLADLFNAFHEKDRRFSFRNFARLAGSTSPNYLQLIRDRKLNISAAAVVSIGKAVPLARRERSYFEVLVAFDHARTHEEKDRLFQQILQVRIPGSVKQLHRDQYEYFSHWYIPVIRELVIAPDYTGDPAWIAGKIIPPVSPSKIRKGIRLLESLGMIQKAPGTNAWIQTDQSVSTPSEVLSVAITRYHHDVITIGRDALDRFDARERDIRSVTMGLSPEAYRAAKDRLETFWKELLAYCAGQSSPSRVYQLNLQLFPLSKKQRGNR